METFQEAPSTVSKVWVKGETIDAGSRRKYKCNSTPSSSKVIEPQIVCACNIGEDHREKGKLYKPTAKIEDKSTSEKAQEYAKLLSTDAKRDSLLLKKKSQEKKKSNLELFKEELRQYEFYRFPRLNSLAICILLVIIEFKKNEKNGTSTNRLQRPLCMLHPNRIT